MDQDMEDFFTRERANEGLEVPLHLPNGNLSEHKLWIRGVDSDEFRRADSESRRSLSRIMEIEDLVKRDEEVENIKLKLIAACIISWTFSQECTMENKVKFLRQAPQIADAVDRVATSRKLFFLKESASSENLPTTTSDSNESPKGPSNP